MLIVILSGIGGTVLGAVIVLGIIRQIFKKGWF